jgi:glycerol-3-phosphate dehydrogenase (NAD(P)+)
MNSENRVIGVIGAGSWGTALANLLARKGYPIDLWVFEPEVREQIEQDRENKVFLPGVRLSEKIFPTNEMKRAVSAKQLVVVVVPSHVMRITAQNLAEYVSPETIIVSATKGIENETLMLMSEVLLDGLPNISEDHIAILSGPSFAKEVARQAPTLITVAAKEPSVASYIQPIFATPYFRVYTNDDMIGVQAGGSMKNYIAIAAGMVDGAEIGLNIRAALITRGLAEMRRLGVKMGANPHTFSGLSGLGDLVLTCTGNLSRNYTVGKQIGQGKKLDDILSQMRMVAEGVRTAKSVYHLSRKIGVEMPICDSVYHILFEGADPKETLHLLMTRQLKGELEAISVSL